MAGPSRKHALATPMRDQLLLAPANNSNNESGPSGKTPKAKAFTKEEKLYIALTVKEKESLLFGGFKSNPEQGRQKKQAWRDLVDGLFAVSSNETGGI